MRIRDWQKIIFILIKAEEVGGRNYIFSIHLSPESCLRLLYKHTIQHQTHLKLYIFSGCFRNLHLLFSFVYFIIFAAGLCQNKSIQFDNDTLQSKSLAIQLQPSPNQQTKLFISTWSKGCQVNSECNVVRYNSI